MTDEEKGLAVVELTKTPAWQEILTPWFMEEREIASHTLENRPKTIEEVHYQNGRIHLIRDFFYKIQGMVDLYLDLQKAKKEETSKET